MIMTPSHLTIKKSSEGLLIFSIHPMQNHQ